MQSFLATSHVSSVYFSLLVHILVESKRTYGLITEALQNYSGSIAHDHLFGHPRAAPSSRKLYLCHELDNKRYTYSDTFSPTPSKRRDCVKIAPKIHPWFLSPNWIFSLCRVKATALRCTATLGSGGFLSKCKSIRSLLPLSTHSGARRADVLSDPFPPFQSLKDRTLEMWMHVISCSASGFLATQPTPFLI